MEEEIQSQNLKNLEDLFRKLRKVRKPQWSLKLVERIQKL
jgi:lipoate synthase